MPLTGHFYPGAFGTSEFFVRKMFKNFFHKNRREVRSTDQNKMLRSNFQTYAQSYAPVLGIIHPSGCW